MSVVLQRCTRSNYLTCHFFMRTDSARYFGGCPLEPICVRRRLHSDDCQRLASIEAPYRLCLADEPQTCVQLVWLLLTRFPCECEHGFVCTFHIVSQCCRTFRLTLHDCSFVSSFLPESKWLQSNTITFLQHWQDLGSPVIVG